MNHKLLTFANPVIDFIDSGKLFRKPFSWLYLFFALANLFTPFYIFYKAIDNNLFDMPAKFAITFLLVWVTITFACWIGLQIWYNRSKVVGEITNQKDEFVAIPVFCHFIKTFGEWLGIWFAIVGTAFAIIASLFLGDSASSLSGSLGIDFLSFGFSGIFISPIVGLIIIVVAKVFAELISALAAIANNTKEKEGVY